MRKHFRFLLLAALFLSCQICVAQNQFISLADPRKYEYTYQDRKHNFSEDVKHVSILYGVAWAVYLATQSDTVNNKGSWQKYRDHLGKLTFDKDEPIWNMIAHPYVGSQMYLYYRANGYDQFQSLEMTFIQSTLFELTIETYTEKASIQDLYITPIIGSILGFGLEKLSLYLLNSESRLAHMFGHVLNPMTLFWFYEGKVRLTPKIRGPKDGSVSLVMDF